MKKIILLPILILSTLILILLTISSFYTPGAVSKVQIGISFSPKYAQKLGLDWQQTYLDILTNLKVKNIRLNSYWRDLAPKYHQYNFSQLDFLIDQAEKHQVKVMLVVGSKQPGWPECFAPGWAKQLTLKDRQKQTEDFIEVVIKRYQSHPAIIKWQIENEPLFDYGADCDPKDTNFLQSEVALVKKLDPSHDVVITDSGELGFWATPMQNSDIFGTTLYRKVHNPILGFFVWPLPPGFYSLKSDLVRYFFAPFNKQTIVSELQVEPWFSSPFINTAVDRQLDIFSIKDFKSNVDFAKKTGFDEIYLWGTEWWYYMAKNGHPEYLEYAKSLFK